MSLAFVFVVLFASFKYTKDAAELSIDAWRAVSTREMAWEESAHRKAYGEIQKLGIEDFSTAAAASGSIPLTQTASRNKLAEVYAAAAIEDFGSNGSPVVTTRCSGLAISSGLWHPSGR